MSSVDWEDENSKRTASRIRAGRMSLNLQTDNTTESIEDAEIMRGNIRHVKLYSWFSLLFIRSILLCSLNARGYVYRLLETSVVKSQTGQSPSGACWEQGYVTRRRRNGRVSHEWYGTHFALSFMCVIVGTEISHAILIFNMTTVKGDDVDPFLASLAFGADVKQTARTKKKASSSRKGGNTTHKSRRREIATTSIEINRDNSKRNAPSQKKTAVSYTATHKDEHNSTCNSNAASNLTDSKVRKTVPESTKAEAGKGKLKSKKGRNKLKENVNSGHVIEKPSADLGLSTHSDWYLVHGDVSNSSTGTSKQSRTHTMVNLLYALPLRFQLCYTSVVNYNTGKTTTLPYLWKKCLDACGSTRRKCGMRRSNSVWMFRCEHRIILRWFSRTPFADNCSYDATNWSC